MQIGVIGASSATAQGVRLSEEVGRELARRRVTLICGGLGGIMEGAARGAWQEGGTTVGILPGDSPFEANPFIGVPVVTGLSHARNVIIARSSHALIAIEGEYGTLSEIAIALKLGKPVVSLHSWNISEDVIPADTAREAVDKAIRLARKEAGKASGSSWWSVS
jgi:uncharacterized protein (TIGR00725 family)